MRDAAAFFGMLSSIFLSTPTFVVVVVAVCGRCWRAFDARENDDDVSRDGDTIVFVVVVDDDDDVVFFRRSPGKRTTPLPTPKDVYDDEKNANWWCERNGKTRKDDDEDDEDDDDENLERVRRVVVVDIGRRGRGRHEDDEDDEGECRTTFDGKATVE